MLRNGGSGGLRLSHRRFKRHELAHIRYSLTDSTSIGHRTFHASQVRYAFRNFSIPRYLNVLALRVIGHVCRFQHHATIEHACASRLPTHLHDSTIISSRPHLRFARFDHPTAVAPSTTLTIQARIAKLEAQLRQREDASGSSTRGLPSVRGPAGSPRTTKCASVISDASTMFPNTLARHTYLKVLRQNGLPAIVTLITKKRQP
jgi:hypothetical protein